MTTSHPDIAADKVATYPLSSGGAGVFARWMSCRSQPMPPASTLAHWPAVSRIERSSNRSSGAAGGRPRGRFSCSMRPIVKQLMYHNKSLAFGYLLYNNKCTETHTGASEMATIKYFSDITDQSVELKGIHQMDNAQFAARWPSVRGIRADGYSKWVAHPTTGTGGVAPVTRMIEMKRFPTKHECNAKCLNGKHNGTCECRCGGKNHGRGMFTRMLEAA